MRDKANLSFEAKVEQQRIITQVIKAIEQKIVRAMIENKSHVDLDEYFFKNLNATFLYRNFCPLEDELKEANLIAGRFNNGYRIEWNI